MPRPYPPLSPHPRLTPASTTSRVELEHRPGDVIAYRLNDGPWRPVAPAPYGLYDVLLQLDALVEVVPASPQDAASLERLERELHEDLLAHEARLRDRENAHLYGRTDPPPRVCERDARGRFLPGPDPDRHVFTRDECIDGFWAAIESIQARYPDAINAIGVHISHTFLKSKEHERVAR